MKKLMLILTVCCLIGGGDLLAASMLTGPKVVITLEFGSKQSPNCLGSGFCRIKIGGNLKMGDGTLAEIQFNEETGRLTWELKLKPAEKKVIKFTYSVERDKDKPVS